MTATVSVEENREFAERILKESYHEERAREQAHRALPNSEQPWMVICFGILTYKVIWTAPDGSPESCEAAERELDWWQSQAERGDLAVLPLSRHVARGDFQLQQQWSLDQLSQAIRDSY